MGQMGRRRSGERKRPRVGMGTPRLIRLKDPRFVWSHLRAAVVDLVRVHPVAVDDDAAKLLGGAAHALLSMDLGKVRREVSVSQIGTGKEAAFRAGRLGIAWGPALLASRHAGRGRGGTHLGHILDPADQP